MRREMQEDKSDMAAEIARLGKALEGAEHKASGLEGRLETERKGRGEAQEQITALRIANARLEERVQAAEGRAGELKAQVEGLQIQLAEIAKQQERTGQTAQAPKPQDP